MQAIAQHTNCFIQLGTWGDAPLCLISNVLGVAAVFTTASKLFVVAVSEPDTAQKPNWDNNRNGNCPRWQGRIKMFAVGFVGREGVFEAD